MSSIVYPNLLHQSYNIMKNFSFIKLVLFVSLFLCSALVEPTFAQDKPILSEAIRTSIDTKGVEAAKKQFTDMDKSQRERYNVDMEGISTLTNDYLEEGNLEALTAISEIISVFMQDMIAQSMDEYAPGMPEKMAEQREAEREQQAKEREEERKQERQEQIVERQGHPRSDLERFTGLYGDPKATNSTRQLWVQVSCDEYLVSGAMWGDAAPWWLTSESENIFTYKDSFNNLRMEFVNEGNTLKMIHDLEFLKSPLVRTGPLPEDWESCLERYQ